MQTKKNWFGLAGSITVITLIIISMFVPWWQLTVGDDLVTTNASPLNTNFNFIGDSFTIPLIMALNIASIISLSAGGIVMLIYSIKPQKSYSNRLLSFAYKKPLYSVLLFVIGLLLITILVKSLFSIDVPLSGSVTSTLPTDMTQGVTLSVQMNAEFLWPFLLATLSAGLCIAARVYHKKIAPINIIKSTPRSPTIITANPISATKS
ncbi:hypothetical protein ACFLRN_08105 [Thermoproteota archaeon]